MAVATPGATGPGRRQQAGRRRAGRRRAAEDDEADPDDADGRPPGAATPRKQERTARSGDGWGVRWRRVGGWRGGCR
uniref:Uncharacterized protein n=1 Tax=Setaria viridis TaxID=4556 RepID=A0A4U6W4J3_SETVI|nr:hypothetical protein SEVIR_1G046650v2 [Setaria viridis]